MNLFNSLLNESSNGRFDYEINGTTEINVDLTSASIRVVTVRKPGSLDIVKNEVFGCLYGSFGRPSVEYKFNEIVKEFAA